MRTLAVLALLLAPACAPNLDNESLERDIREGLFDSSGIDAESVTCEQGVECKRGRKSRCTAIAEGGEIALQVTQTDDQCERRWIVNKGTISSSKIEDRVEQAFRDKTGREAIVDCGRRYRVAIAGRQFDCEIENRKGEAATIKVTVEDDLEHVAWKLDL